MSQLKAIHRLLREEYARSRHIFWLDETTGKFVNDITQVLGLIVQTARCLRCGDQNCWQELVTYCLERSMSARLMQAIGVYLSGCGLLEALPIIDFDKPMYRNWRDGEVPLLDETDYLLLAASTETPEPGRKLHLKGAHQWSRYPLRLRDEHPAPETQTVSKSQHWLF